MTQERFIPNVKSIIVNSPRDPSFDLLVSYIATENPIVVKHKSGHKAPDRLCSLKNLQKLAQFLINRFEEKNG